VSAFRLAACFAVLITVAFSSVALGVTRAPTPPLSQRVNEAELVFVGKVVNKVVEGDWARAEILVEQPLKNTVKDAKVPVTWRINLGNFIIYDTPEGSRGIAILKDKHQGRYWLRGDKFERPDQLEKVREILTEAAGGDS
jgi:hypothetical protein